MNNDVDFVLLRSTADMGPDNMQHASRRVGIAGIICAI